MDLYKYLLGGIIDYSNNNYDQVTSRSLPLLKILSCISTSLVLIVLYKRVYSVKNSNDSDYDSDYDIDTVISDSDSDVDNNSDSEVDKDLLNRDLLIMEVGPNPKYTYHQIVNVIANGDNLDNVNVTALKADMDLYDCIPGHVKDLINVLMINDKNHFNINKEIIMDPSILTDSLIDDYQRAISLGDIPMYQRQDLYTEMFRNDLNYGVAIINAIISTIVDINIRNETRDHLSLLLEMDNPVILTDFLLKLYKHAE
jgi:hypothetical protein